MSSDFILTNNYETKFFTDNYLEIEDNEIFSVSKNNESDLNHNINKEKIQSDLSKKINNIFMKEKNYNECEVSTQKTVLKNLSLILEFQLESDKEIEERISEIALNLFTKASKEIDNPQKGSFDDKMSETTEHISVFTEHISVLQDLLPYKQQLSGEKINLDNAIQNFIYSAGDNISEEIQDSFKEDIFDTIPFIKLDNLYKALCSFLNNNIRSLRMDQFSTFQSLRNSLKYSMKSRLKPDMIISDIKYEAEHIKEKIQGICKIRINKEFTEEEKEKEIKNEKGKLEKIIKNTFSQLESVLTTSGIFENWDLADCYKLYACTCLFVSEYKKYMEESKIEEFKNYILSMKERIQQKKVPELRKILLEVLLKLQYPEAKANNDFKSLIQRAQTERPTYPSEQFRKRDLNVYLEGLKKWVKETDESLNEYLTGNKSLYKQKPLEDLIVLFSSLTEAESANIFIPERGEKVSLRTMVDDVKEELKKFPKEFPFKEKIKARRILKKLYNRVETICKNLENTSELLLIFNNSIASLQDQLNSKEVKYPLEISLPFCDSKLTISEESELRELLNSKLHREKVEKMDKGYKGKMRSKMLHDKSLYYDILKCLNKITKSHLVPLKTAIDLLS